jgi:16S rRNA (uracil1498-N3)-methyltransferase
VKLFLINRSVGPSREIVLEGSDYRHLVQVRRLGPGDVIEARDADGRRFTMTLSEIDRQNNRASGLLSELQSPAGAEQLSQPEFVLVQGLPKGKKTDQIIRQAVECGASEIILVKTQYSVPSIDRADFTKKSQRWRTIIAEAVQQSGSPGIPSLKFFPGVEELIASGIPGDGLGVFFH